MGIAPPWIDDHDPTTGDDMVAFLRRHKLASKFSQAEEFVFASRSGTPLSHRNVQVRGFEAARNEAELPETPTFHKLRHAFASLAAHRGVTMNLLSEVMGHAHVGITQSIYSICTAAIRRKSHSGAR
jgi:site-specific recombinase XerD